MAPTAHPLREYILIDTETTGFGAAAELVEVAALHVRDGVAVGRYQSLARPRRAIPWQATRVHGITDAMVRSAPSESDVVLALRTFVGGLPLVAHNASFDVTVLRGAFVRAGLAAPGCVVWCSLKLSRRFITDAPSHGLQALARHLSLAAQPAHRAMGDALTAQALLGVILARTTAMQLRAVGPSAVL